MSHSQYMLLTVQQPKGPEYVKTIRRVVSSLDPTDIYMEPLVMVAAPVIRLTMPKIQEYCWGKMFASM